MSIDKNWTRPALNRNSPEFKRGLNDFYERRWQWLLERMVPQTMTHGSLAPSKRDGEKKKLPIKFDLNDLRTVKPIGPNRRHFTGLIGNEIERSVPFCYESWEALPEKYKGTLWPAINTYFDMKTHLSGPNAKQVEKGMEAQFKSQYKNRKNKFKDEMFVRHGRYKEPEKMRNFPLRGKSLSEWHELLGHMPLADTRSGRPMVYGVFPNLIELYKKTHQKEGKWAKDVFEARYIKMQKLRVSQEGLEEKMIDDEIMDKVLGSSRAFKPGRVLEDAAKVLEEAAKELQRRVRCQ
ncbi:hypothetical protein Tco_0354967, partial [Tanacetum coccineum]